MGHWQESACQLQGEDQGRRRARNEYLAPKHQLIHRLACDEFLLLLACVLHCSLFHCTPRARLDERSTVGSDWICITAASCILSADLNICSFQINSIDLINLSRLTFGSLSQHVGALARKFGCQCAHRCALRIARGSESSTGWKCGKAGARIQPIHNEWRVCVQYSFPASP
jgi:hypothetical protein